jgi:hypothetical protein
LKSGSVQALPAPNVDGAPPIYMAVYEHFIDHAVRFAGVPK